MGGGSWTSRDWAAYSSTRVTGKTDKGLFTSVNLHSDLDVKNVDKRESKDSDSNPNSTALIVGVDVTGSMGKLAVNMIKSGCNTLATEIYNRKPITDPHVMFMGIGDVYCDSAPLQVTQFEADIRIAEHLQKMYIEGGGGGNNSESYTFPWYFAAMHTDIDCFEKRGKKGYLFTVGDECVPAILTANEIDGVLGYKPQKDFTAEELYTMVSRKYHVFHLMVEQGNFMRSHRKAVIESWTKILGQRAILLKDSDKMAEVIVSTIQAIEGESIETIVKSWDGSTGVVVNTAIKDLVPGDKITSDIVEFS